MGKRTFGIGLGALVGVAALSLTLAADDERITQDAIASGELSLREIRAEGLRMFATRFDKPRGYGDGPHDIGDAVTPGGRPTLGGNGMLLRINGLDAQSCIECHSILRADTVPPTFGIGGVGGSSANAMIKPTAVDPADLLDADGIAAFDGRFANPPFVFGAGAVELLGLEMTADLQAAAQYAMEHPGVEVPLDTHGVNFGSVVADAAGNLDTSGVDGVDPDLVVKPFGRKGEFATVREFDIDAMQFHFGMQPTEVVGDGLDGDGDGIFDEVLAGELSALSAFVSTMEPPRASKPHGAALRGLETFLEIGCASCHVPSLEARETRLPLRFPEVRVEPAANAFLWVDLTRPPMRFERSAEGGIVVPFFADLKRHDMGPALAETFIAVDGKRNSEFTTARLWGVADTAPYLHDGRASTLFEAIDLHGGEAQAARDAFAALGTEGQDELIAFLGTLRTPDDPARDLVAGPGPRGRRPQGLDATDDAEAAGLDQGPGTAATTLDRN